MFLINLQGKDSIYEQIKTQIIKFISVGVLKPEDKLPTVRELANQLSINPNTVMKAYSELENEGYIYTLNKKGAYVSKEINTIYNDKIKKAYLMIQSLKNENYSKLEIETIVNEVYKEANNA